jgi:hypothetical protein
MITALPLGFSGLKTVSVGLLTLAILVTLSLKVEYSLSKTGLLFGTTLYKGIIFADLLLNAEDQMIWIVYHYTRRYHKHLKERSSAKID